MSPPFEYKVSLVSLAVTVPLQICARWEWWGLGIHSHGHCSVQVKEGKVLGDKPGAETVAGVKRTFSHVGKYTQNKTHYA